MQVDLTPNLKIMNKMKVGIILLLAAVSFGCRIDTKPITTIFIVRHAEKDISDPKNQDPELSAEGRERAEALAGKLKQIKLDAVYATKYKRTGETAYSSAKNSNVEVQTYDAQDFRGIAELVKTKHKGQKVLIIGHSNTVLELLEAFGASRPIVSLSDDDYDFFFELRIGSNGKTVLKAKHYGKVHHSSPGK